MSRSIARIAMRNAIIELKGKKTSQQIADHFGITRGAVTGIWWRANPLNKMNDVARKRKERRSFDKTRVL